MKPGLGVEVCKLLFQSDWLNKEKPVRSIINNYYIKKLFIYISYIISSQMTLH